MIGYCQHCGDKLSGKGYEVKLKDGSRVKWCGFCVDVFAYKCSVCEEYVDAVKVLKEDTTICYQCLKEKKKIKNIIECEECQYLFDESELTEINGHKYCRECANRVKRFLDEPKLYGYHESIIESTLQFFGDASDGPFLGIELEIDGGSNRNDLIKEISKLFPKNFIVFETDGSLDCGIECITRPATLAFHSSLEEAYRKMFKIATREPYKFMSHKTGTCGLHVHFNRSYFDEDYTGKESDVCITRLLYLIEKFWNELVIFSRRKSNQLHWCNKYAMKPEEIVKEQPIKKDRSSLERYVALNLTNEETIEFRLFRGTMNIDSFFASLDLFNNLVTIAKHTKKTKTLMNMEFSELLTNERLANYWERVKQRKNAAATLTK